MQRTLILLILLTGTLHAGENDIRQVRSLADRGLFDAAEIFAFEQFEQPGLNETDKILLAAELTRSYSLHLLLLEPGQRTRILRSLETLENRWLTPPAASADAGLLRAKLVLRLQIAMAHSALGDYLRLEADTVSLTNRPAAQQLARDTLHDVLNRLKTCQQELQTLRQRLGQHAYMPNADTQASGLQALDSAITMQQALARKSLALTFQEEADRNFELRQAVALLSPLAAINSTEPIIIQCKIEKAACLRLAGELEQGREILEQLFQSTLTPGCRLRLETEWIRSQIASGNILETRRQYAAGREQAQLYPEFHIALLELFTASDAERNIRAETAAAMRLEQAVDRELGPYWARRARLLVSVSGNTELNSAEMSAVRGGNLYREGRFAEAAALYEQAAVQADAGRQAENMFRYHRLAAHSWMQALEQLPRDETSMEYQQRVIALLRKLAEQDPAHHEARDFHALALNLRGQLAVLQPEPPDDYLSLLDEHSARWPASPDLPAARRLAVILLERHGRIEAAAAVLPLLDREQSATLPPEIQRLRARQLDAEGKTQDAVDLLVGLLNQSREAATLQLFAEILTRQPDAGSLGHALNFWRELESITEKDGETWWTAREGILAVLIKLNRHEEAREAFALLCVLYPGLGGTDRHARLHEMFSGW